MLISIPSGAFPGAGGETPRSQNQVPVKSHVFILQTRKIRGLLLAKVKICYTCLNNERMCYYD